MQVHRAYPFLAQWQSVVLIAVLQFRHCLLRVVWFWHHSEPSIHFSWYSMVWPGHCNRQLSCIVLCGRMVQYHSTATPRQLACNQQLSCIVWQHYGVAWPRPLSGTCMQSAIVLFVVVLYCAIVVWPFFMILVDTSQTQKVKSKSVSDMDFPDQSECTNTEITSLLDLTSVCLLRWQVSENLNPLYTESLGFFRPAF